MKASIVIRCRNEAATIGEVLDRVLTQRFDDGREVLVLDSGSTDGTIEIVQRFPVVLDRLPPEAFSFGYALNRGAALVGGEYVVFLSAHCLPTNDLWLQGLTAPLDADPNTVATFGRQTPRRGVNPFEEVALCRDFPPPGPTARVRFSNANCAIRRRLLLHYPFDEQVQAAEDFLWAHQLPAAYRIAYVDAACVYHSHPIRLRYWAGRFYALGLATQHMKYRYGIDNPWGASTDTAAAGARRWIGEKLRPYVTHLLREGYLPYLLLLPVYELTKAIGYLRGLRRGRELYRREVAR